MRVIFLFIFFIITELSAFSEVISGDVEWKTVNYQGSRINYVKFPRSSPDLFLGIGLPEKKRNFSKLETTSQIYQRYAKDTDKELIASINGGLFGEEKYIAGCMLSENSLIQMSGSIFETFVLTDSRDIFTIDNIKNPGGKLMLENGETFDIAGINIVRPDNEIVVYDSYWGNSTSTKFEGIEIIVDKCNKPVRTWKFITGTISKIQIDSVSKNNAIPVDGVVISVNKNMAETLKAKLKEGMNITFKFNASNDIINNALFMITGGGMLLEKSAAKLPLNPKLSESFIKNPNPRTVLAWNSTDIFLITVDGRQISSRGMSFQDLRNFLLNELKATDALNLDGGGSTTMIVKGNVVNQPSDLKGERPVANTILLYKKNKKISSEIKASAVKDAEIPLENKTDFIQLLPFSPSPDKKDKYSIILKNRYGSGNTIHLGSLQDSDYIVNADIYCDIRQDLKQPDNEIYGIFTRDNGNFAFISSIPAAGNAYALIFDSSDDRIKPGIIKNGNFGELKTKNATQIKKSSWHNFGIKCSGKNIVYELDKKTILNIEDSTFSRGGAGIGYIENINDNTLIKGAAVENFSLSPIIISK